MRYAGARIAVVVTCMGYVSAASAEKSAQGGIYWAAPPEAIANGMDRCHRFNTHSLEEQLGRLKEKYGDQLTDEKIGKTAGGGRIFTANREDAGSVVHYVYFSALDDCERFQASLPVSASNGTAAPPDTGNLKESGHPPSPPDPGGTQGYVEPVGAVLSYPRDASIAVIRREVPDLDCQKDDARNQTACFFETGLFKAAILTGYNFTCIMGKEMSLDFKDDKLYRVGCPVAKLAWTNLGARLYAEYGEPATDTVFLLAMATKYYEWRVGDDYILLSEWFGDDAYGKPVVNKYEVSISTRKGLPAGKSSAASP